MGVRVERRWGVGGGAGLASKLRLFLKEQKKKEKMKTNRMFMKVNK